jgi:hypothetical protein
VGGRVALKAVAHFEVCIVSLQCLNCRDRIRNVTCLVPLSGARLFFFFVFPSARSYYSKLHTV